MQRAPPSQALNHTRKIEMMTFSPNEINLVYIEFLAVYCHRAANVEGRVYGLLSRAVKKSNRTCAGGKSTGIKQTVHMSYTNQVLLVTLPWVVGQVS